MEESLALGERIQAVRERIAAAAARSEREAGAVTLVAVTKKVPVAAIQAAYEQTLRIFGENRIQEAQAKIPELRLPEIRWELVGHLQTNKINEALALFHRVQSVDSLRLAEKLDAHAGARGRVMPILLEVNVGREANKLGVLPDGARDAARALARFAHLRVEGLMTVAPIGGAEEVRPIFRWLRELRDELRATVPLPNGGAWRELSMGMTDDFEAAIQEGATLVRVGRAIFGERPPD
jgi:PLP dependent protein